VKLAALWIVLAEATGLDDLRADYRGGENRSLTAIDAVESDPLSSYPVFT
jgi:hypothetical protein